MYIGDILKLVPSFLISILIYFIASYDLNLNVYEFIPCYVIWWKMLNSSDLNGIFKKSIYANTPFWISHIFAYQSQELTYLLLMQTLLCTFFVNLYVLAMIYETDAKTMALGVITEIMKRFKLENYYIGLMHALGKPVVKELKINDFVKASAIYDSDQL